MLPVTLPDGLAGTTTDLIAGGGPETGEDGTFTLPPMQPAPERLPGDGAT